MVTSPTKKKEPEDLSTIKSQTMSKTRRFYDFNERGEYLHLPRTERFVSDLVVAAAVAATGYMEWLVWFGFFFFPARLMWN